MESKRFPKAPHVELVQNMKQEQRHKEIHLSKESCIREKQRRGNGRRKKNPTSALVSYWSGRVPFFFFIFRPDQPYVRRSRARSHFLGLIVFFQFGKLDLSRVKHL